MGDDVNWVNPAAVIQKRKRKTASRSSFAPASVEEKENVPKKVVKDSVFFTFPEKLGRWGLYSL